MQNKSNGNYTEEQVMEMLHSKYHIRQIDFRYDLLDKFENKKFTLQSVESGEISMSSLSSYIKRTARFRIREESSENINWLGDRIQPFMLLKMPDGNWIEWSLGIFLLSSPTRKKDIRVYRDVEAFDGIQILKEDKITHRFTALKDSKYIDDNVIPLLQEAGITKINIQASTELLSVDREWKKGTPKIQIINELLKDINYTELWVDEWGYFISKKYISPNDRGVDYTYIDDNLSIMLEDIEEELDTFNVPNKWSVSLSNVEVAPLTSVFINNNANSPTSYANRGYYVTSEKEIDYISSQQALDEYTQRLAYEENQIHGNVNFRTEIMPFHSYNDILYVRNLDMSIGDKYEEVGWTLPLNDTTEMTHTVRKVVSL